MSGKPPDRGFMERIAKSILDGGGSNGTREKISGGDTIDLSDPSQRNPNLREVSYSDDFTARQKQKEFNKRKTAKHDRETEYQEAYDSDPRFNYTQGPSSQWSSEPFFNMDDQGYYDDGHGYSNIESEQQSVYETKRLAKQAKQQARDDFEQYEQRRPLTNWERARGYRRRTDERFDGERPRMDWDARFGVDADPNSMYEQGSWGQFRDAGSVYARQKLRGAPRGAARLGVRGVQRGAELGWRGTKAGARLGAQGARLGAQGAIAGAQLGYQGVATGAKYGVVDPLRRAGGMISAADAIALQGISNVRRSGQRLGTAERGSQYLGLQKGAIRHTLPQSTGALNGVMRGLAGLFILFIFISVFYMVFGPLYDVLITNFLLIAGADGSTMLGGKDIATLYANTANAILIWVPLIVIGGTLYLLISMVFERESKGLAGSNIMTEWDVFGGMEDDSNLDIALDGGIDEPMGLYGPS